MGKRIGPKKVHRYSAEFKLTAVKLTKMPGIEVPTVAAALDIHPFMLSRWRKEVREGALRGKAKQIEIPPQRTREIRRLQVLERAHAILKAEHELLKKAIRFSSERKRRSSSSLSPNATPSRSTACVRSTA